jgi:hypothetical protein
MPHYAKRVLLSHEAQLRLNANKNKIIKYANFLLASKKVFLPSIPIPVHHIQLQIQRFFRISILSLESSNETFSVLNRSQARKQES